MSQQNDSITATTRPLEIKKVKLPKRVRVEVNRYVVDGSRFGKSEKIAVAWTIRNGAAIAWALRAASAPDATASYHVWTRGKGSNHSIGCLSADPHPSRVQELMEGFIQQCEMDYIRQETKSREDRAFSIWLRGITGEEFAMKPYGAAQEGSQDFDAAYKEAFRRRDHAAIVTFIRSKGWSVAESGVAA